MGLDRREFLQRSAVILGASLSPGCVSAVLSRGPDEELRTDRNILSAAQRATLDPMVDRILPKTDTPGALDAGVPDFIEFVLAEGATPEVQSSVMKGLLALNERAQSLHGGDFSSLQPEQQDGVLRESELAEFASGPPGAAMPFGQAPAKPFFASIKEWTLVGFLTSEVGAHSFRHVTHMPGRFDACVAVEPGTKPYAGSF